MENKINTFKIGTNFDSNLPKLLHSLNQKYSNKITEVFGSIRLHSRYAARPDFRLPNVSTAELAEHVAELKKYNIDFNYTLNAPFIGSSAEISNLTNELLTIVQTLINIGVTRFTITSPLIAMILRDTFGSLVSLELSTIAHLSQITQLKSYNDLVGISRFCMNLEKNRDFSFLGKCQEVATKYGWSINLMVNEFCSTSNVGYSSHCILRNDCYLLHSVNKTKEDYDLNNGYSMSYCMAGREIEPYSWLRTRFILPQWLRIYNENTGISHFKITGRTGTTSYILKVAKAYMSEQFDGDLLELWKHIETIYNNTDDTIVKNKRLPIKTLIEHGFINHWLDPDVPPCSNLECGADCNYCNDFYKKYIQTINN